MRKREVTPPAFASPRSLSRRRPVRRPSTFSESIPDRGAAESAGASPASMRYSIVLILYPKIAQFTGNRIGSVGRIGLFVVGAGGKQYRTQQPAEGFPSEMWFHGLWILGVRSTIRRRKYSGEKGFRPAFPKKGKVSGPTRSSDRPYRHRKRCSSAKSLHRSGLFRVGYYKYTKLFSDSATFYTKKSGGVN